MDTKQLICPAGHRDGYLYKVRKPFTKMGFVDTLKSVLWMCNECEEELIKEAVVYGKDLL